MVRAEAYIQDIGLRLVDDVFLLLAISNALILINQLSGTVYNYQIFSRVIEGFYSHSVSEYIVTICK